jgi:hypothetical protein
MGLKIKTKTVETIRQQVTTLQSDIVAGKCGLIWLCMHKLAIERMLRDLDPKGGDHKVRIDGGTFRFHLGGYRWEGITPKPVKRSLIQFDKERKPKERAERLGIPFESKVKPQTYWIEAQKQGKIEPFTAERQKQINEARHRRKAEGRPDNYRSDLRFRIEGLGNV